MTDEQFERLLSCVERNTASNERLANSMEALQVSNTLLLNAITVEDSEGTALGTPKGTTGIDTHTMDDSPQ